MTHTSANKMPSSDQNVNAAQDAALRSAAEAIRSAYLQFAQAVQPSIDYYAALGARAEHIRKENEKLPL